MANIFLGLDEKIIKENSQRERVSKKIAKIHQTIKNKEEGRIREFISKRDKETSERRIKGYGDYKKEQDKLVSKERKSQIKKQSKLELQRLGKLMDKAAKTKMKSRRVMKKSSVDIKIPAYKAESSWDDPNRFFKNELEETKRSMFL